MFKIVFQDFKGEFLDNIKAEKKNMFLYIILTVTYIFLTITSYRDNDDKRNIVQLVNFLMLFVVVKCIHNIYPNKLRDIMFLMPLTDEEKYKYLEIRLIIKQLIILIITGGINIAFVCAGYIKLSPVIYIIICVQILSLVLGIVTNYFDRAIKTFFETINIIVGILNFMFILSGESLMEIPRNINNIIIAVLSVFQVAGLFMIMGKFKEYAQIEPKEPGR